MPSDGRTRSSATPVRVSKVPPFNEPAAGDMLLTTALKCHSADCEDRPKAPAITFTLFGPRDSVLAGLKAHSIVEMGPAATTEDVHCANWPIESKLLS